MKSIITLITAAFVMSNVLAAEPAKKEEAKPTATLGGDVKKAEAKPAVAAQPEKSAKPAVVAKDTKEAPAAKAEAKPVAKAEAKPATAPATAPATK